MHSKARANRIGERERERERERYEKHQHQSVRKRKVRELTPLLDLELTKVGERDQMREGLLVIKLLNRFNRIEER